MQIDSSRGNAKPEPSGLPQSEPAEKDTLPDAGGALPLLSVIGFGVLLGGIASALKTR